MGHDLGLQYSRKCTFWLKKNDLLSDTLPWAQVVEEEEVLLRFVQSIQKYNRLSQQQAQKQQIGQMMKKPMPMAGPMSKMPPMPPGAFVAKRAPNR